MHNDRLLTTFANQKDIGKDGGKDHGQDNQRNEYGEIIMSKERRADSPQWVK